MAAQLHQIIALEKGARTRAATDLTNAAATLAKPQLLSGISRTYRPRNDDPTVPTGQQLPPESTRVQVRTADILTDVRAALGRLFDITLIKDATNATATANIVIDGVMVAYNVPVTYLIWLEKRIAELSEFVKRIPVLDPAEVWSFSAAQDAWATEPAETVRSQKVPRNHVKAEATDRFPAQVEMYTEDVPVGTWTTIKYSGALPQSQVTELKARLVKLADAVKVAREFANTAVVVDRKIGDDLFGYVFGS